MEGIKKAFPKAEIVRADHLMVELRSIKSRNEIACLKEGYSASIGYPVILGKLAGKRRDIVMLAGLRGAERKNENDRSVWTSSNIFHKFSGKAYNYTEEAFSKVSPSWLMSKSKLEGEAIKSSRLS